jgi:hypothetical protein
MLKVDEDPMIGGVLDLGYVIVGVVLDGIEIGSGVVVWSVMIFVDGFDDKLE